MKLKMLLIVFFAPLLVHSAPQAKDFGENFSEIVDANILAADQQEYLLDSGNPLAIDTIKVYQGTSTLKGTNGQTMSCLVVLGYKDEKVAEGEIISNVTQSFNGLADLYARRSKAVRASLTENSRALQDTPFVAGTAGLITFFIMNPSPLMSVRQSHVLKGNDLIMKRVLDITIDGTTVGSAQDTMRLTYSPSDDLQKADFRYHYKYRRGVFDNDSVQATCEGLSEVNTPGGQG